LLLAGLATPAAAQDIPAAAPNCSLSAPPEAAARGFHPPRGLPKRLFPVSPGAAYTGCQWLWIAYGTPINPWDYASVTYYERGAPRIQRVTYPPLPVQTTVQTCLFGADGSSRRRVEGNDWQHECPSARALRERLTLIPKENEVWDFF
jgi:hypothetical protein